jgi:SAM-dependent methyltransferase
MDGGMMHQNGNALPLYNGLAGIDDLKDPAWDCQVQLLSQKNLGGLGIDGWTRHWSRRWEFPWAYRAISRCFSPVSFPQVVESGCGVTPVPYWLGGDGFRVTGIDLDTNCEPKWCDREVPCRPDPGTTKFEPGDMLNLPLPEGSADVVYSVSAIEHTTDPVRAVSEMIRILRPGGGLVLTLDVDICESDSVRWDAFLEIQRILANSTKPLLPTRHVVPTKLMTFENRTVDPQSSSRLLFKQMLDHFGIRKRSNQTVFAWAGTKI